MGHGTILLNLIMCFVILYNFKFSIIHHVLDSRQECSVLLCTVSRGRQIFFTEYTTFKIALSNILFKCSAKMQKQLESIQKTCDRKSSTNPKMVTPL